MTNAARRHDDWNEHEEQYMLDSRANKVKWSTIAAALGRTHDACRTRYQVLTGRRKRVGPKPQAQRIAQLVGTIEAAAAQPKSDVALLRQYRLGLIVLQWKHQNSTAGVRTGEKGQR